MMLGITSILSSWGAGTIGQRDWVRNAERRYGPLLSQMVGAPDDDHDHGPHRGGRHERFIQDIGRALLVSYRSL